MRQLQHNLYHVPLERLFQHVTDQFPKYTYDLKKHVIVLEDERSESLGFIRLPLHLSINSDLSIVSEASNALYLTIESGNAAICLMEGTKNVYHTTFSAYMTRKKQGFSQIKYLNKKGKSRAGSRVRLAKTVEFFENINTTVSELLDEYVIDRLALDCSKTLLPYLYQSKIPFPLDKKDPMLYKIPLHLPQSNFTNLDAAIKKLKSPVLLYEEGVGESFGIFIDSI